MTDLAHLELSERGDFVIARVTGEIDVSMSTRIGDEIMDGVPTAARGLVVDLADLEFIDSSGIAMMFGLVRRLGSRRQELRVVVPRGEAVARVLEIVDFGRAAPLHPDVDTALA